PSRDTRAPKPPPPTLRPEPGHPHNPRPPPLGHRSERQPKAVPGGRARAVVGLPSPEAVPPPAARSRGAVMPEAPPDGLPALHVENVDVTYGRALSALRSVSLTVP